jgi:two-component system OmpR family response regulator
MAVGRVLVVDADVILRRVLRACLEYDELEVLEAESVDRGCALLERETVDLITLDIGFNPDDDIDAGRKLHDNQAAPILVVSANDDRAVRNAALMEFADDYILKPFDVHELLARSRALLRRYRRDLKPGLQIAALRMTQSSASEMHVAGLKIDLAGHRIIDATGNPVELSATEFKMLRAFVTNPNRVLSREHLLELSGGPAASESVDRAIDMRIRRLRQKLDHAGIEASGLIRTVRAVSATSSARRARLETAARHPVRAPSIDRLSPDGLLPDQRLHDLCGFSLRPAASSRLA